MATTRFEVSETAFRFAHGRAPRGRGQWAFEFRLVGGGTELRWVRGEMTFAEARRVVLREASERADVVSVSVAS